MKVPLAVCLASLLAAPLPAASPSIPDFSKTPRAFSSLAHATAALPPELTRIESGFSFAMTRSTNSAVTGRK